AISFLKHFGGYSAHCRRSWRARQDQEKCFRLLLAYCVTGPPGGWCWHRCSPNSAPSKKEAFMRRQVVLAFSLILFCLMSTPAADDKIKDSPYYPLKVGTKWTYRVGTNSFNMQVTKHEKVGDLLCGVIETSKDGNVVLTEYVGVKDDGVYRFSPAGDKVD